MSIKKIKLNIKSSNAQQFGIKTSTPIIDKQLGIKTSDTIIDKQLGIKTSDTIIDKQLGIKTSTPIIDQQLDIKTSHTIIDKQLGIKTSNPIIEKQLNIKTSDPIIGNQLDINIKKVVPYEDDESPTTSPEKIIIKPKIVGASQIKIKVKNYANLQTIATNTNIEQPHVNAHTNVDEETDFSIEPKVVFSINNKTQTMVKLNVKNKTETVKYYKSSILDQKPIKKLSMEPIHLSGKIEVESFYDDGLMYYLDRQSKYIFPPDPNNSNQLLQSFDPTIPIGKLIDLPWEPSDYIENKHPLIKRQIEWFYSYELDVDALN